MMTWNANEQHQQELQTALGNMDVCLVSKTHSTRPFYIKFQRYQVYLTIHSDHAAKGGRVIIIRDTIQYYEGERYELEEIQAMAVNI